MSHTGRVHIRQLQRPAVHSLYSGGLRSGMLNNRRRGGGGQVVVLPRPGFWFIPA